MNSKHIGMLAVVVALAATMLGCALTDRLAARRTSRPSAVANEQATRTPWPTFTPTRMATPTPLPTATATNTPIPTPTFTPLPTETPLPTDTPTPKPKPKPAAPPPTPAPAAPPTPAFQFSPEAWEGQWNGGLAQIRGHVRDANKQPVKGFFVQAKCGGTVIASNPSGINLYAPDKPYEPGAYDMVLSSPLSQNSMCNWEVRVVQAANFEEAKNPSALSLSPSGYCDLTWDEMSICFANWRKNW